MANKRKSLKIYNFDAEQYRTQLLTILEQIQLTDEFDYTKLRKILSKHAKDKSGFFSKDELVSGYNMFIDSGEMTEDPQLLQKIRMKPTRTISGVTTVTVLTKPFPCPGECIFCPNDIRMPKSYLADEPGAQRAERNGFDPYLQTYNRLLALESIGHNTEKIELIVLGGTWSFYPEEYQIWFVKECFRAMNDFGIKDNRDEIENKNEEEENTKVPARKEDGTLRSYNEILGLIEKGKTEELLSEDELSTWEELFEQQGINETAKSRCIGLVIETRPDYVDAEEIIKIRKLGATKVQIGIQTMNDKVHALNKRGHGVKEIKESIRLLRLAGFKIHAHWMPNLYGSSVAEDIDDYTKLWEVGVQPDELKLYPTSIIEDTELFELYKRGKYRPYSYDELMQVLSSVMPTTPRYCRLTRVVRDIPSTDIVAGNKLTNFRQIVEEKLKKDNTPCNCIRCREIKGQNVTEDQLEIEILDYKTSVSNEKFISFKTKEDDKIAGFLRLSLPDKELSAKNFMKELRNKAIIREVHVYGQVVGLGKKKAGRSQHLGLGTRMIDLSKQFAKENGFNELSVISAIGTREYYRKLGFKDDGLYLSIDTEKTS